MGLGFRASHLRSGVLCFAFSSLAFVDIFNPQQRDQHGGPCLGMDVVIMELLLASPPLYRPSQVLCLGHFKECRWSNDRKFVERNSSRFPKQFGYLFGGPYYYKDYSMLGSVWGPFYLGRLPYSPCGIACLQTVLVPSLQLANSANLRV